MAKVQQAHDSILEAVGTIQEYIEKVTGQTATQEEIAAALTRYFVLNEIKEFIVMQREGGE